LDTQTWEYYLAAMQEYRKRDAHNEKYGSRTRKA